MGFHKFIFKAKEPELLIGLLSQYPFEAFEEKDGALEAWLNESEDESMLKAAIQMECTAFFTNLEVEYIPDRNWNETWESRFDPVEIGSFCRIRAVFHESVQGYDHEIVISPKQAFGTGHHETTYMMVQAMQSLDLHGADVLDLGSGTGVLAILAVKLGAAKVVAVDIETEAVDNTLENAELNNVKVDTRLGSTDVVSSLKFDLILANINRNAIMFLLKDIARLLKPGGRVVFSGFLEMNEMEVEEQAGLAGLELEKKMQRGEWLCLGFSRSNF